MSERCERTIERTSELPSSLPDCCSFDSPCLGRVGGPHHVSPFADGAVTQQLHGDHRSADQEVDHVAEIGIRLLALVKLDRFRSNGRGGEARK